MLLKIIRDYSWTFHTFFCIKKLQKVGLSNLKYQKIFRGPSPRTPALPLRILLHKFLARTLLCYHSNASISTSYARSRSIHARLFATRETTVNSLLYRFFSERKGLSALNGTDLANFEDRFWSWTCVHLSLTCVRVRKKYSVGKTLTWRGDRVERGESCKTTEPASGEMIFQDPRFPPKSPKWVKSNFFAPLPQKMPILFHSGNKRQFKLCSQSVSNYPNQLVEAEKLFKKSHIFA